MTLLFIILKLTEHTDISWWWILLFILLDSNRD